MQDFYPHTDVPSNMEPLTRALKTNYGPKQKDPANPTFWNPLEPGCRMLMFLRSFGPLRTNVTHTAQRRRQVTRILAASCGVGSEVAIDMYCISLSNCREHLEF